MSTKAKEAKVSETILYDATAEQRIHITLTKNGKTYDLFHRLAPLSDERYFQCHEEMERLGRRSTTVTTNIYTPKHSLWFDLVQGREGYADKPDWKEKTHHTDAIQAINALLHAQVLDDTEIDDSNAAELYDEDSLTKIPFRALQSGVLMTLTHSYREEAASELDAYLAITTNAPEPNVMASALKTSVAEKLDRLGRAMLRDSEGYAPESHIPAWHIATTVDAFFIRQLARVGKF